MAAFKLHVKSDSNQTPSQVYFLWGSKVSKQNAALFTFVTHLTGRFSNNIVVEVASSGLACSMWLRQTAALVAIRVLELGLNGANEVPPLSTDEFSIELSAIWCYGTTSPIVPFRSALGQGRSKPISFSRCLHWWSHAFASIRSSNVSFVTVQSTKEPTGFNLDGPLICILYAVSNCEAPVLNRNCGLYKRTCWVKNSHFVPQQGRPNRMSTSCCVFFF